MIIINIPSTKAAHKPTKAELTLVAVHKPTKADDTSQAQMNSTIPNRRSTSRLKQRRANNDSVSSLHMQRRHSSVEPSPANATLYNVRNIRLVSAPPTLSTTPQLSLTPHKPRHSLKERLLNPLNRLRRSSFFRKKSSHDIVDAKVPLKKDIINEIMQEILEEKARVEVIKTLIDKKDYDAALSNLLADANDDLHYFNKIKADALSNKHFDAFKKRHGNLIDFSWVERR